MKNNDFINVSSALISLNQSQLQNTLDEISPIGLAGMTEVSIAEDNAMFGNLNGRFNDIRSGVDGFTTSVSNVALDISKDGDKKEVQPVIGKETANHWSIWLSRHRIDEVCAM